MDDNSLFLAILISIFILINIMIIHRERKRVLKQPGHYETMADRHAKRLFHPIADRVWTIIGLIVVSFFVSNVVLLILFIFWVFLLRIQTFVLLVLLNTDLFAIKKGLIRVGCYNFNPYNKGSEVEVLIKDAFYDNGDIIEDAKRLEYQVDNKIVYSHEISIEGLSENDIKEKMYYFKCRFVDYSQYIPNSVFQLENPSPEIENWFLYLGDLQKYY